MTKLFWTLFAHRSQGEIVMFLVCSVADMTESTHPCRPGETAETRAERQDRWPCAGPRAAVFGQQEPWRRPGSRAGGYAPAARPLDRPVTVRALIPRAQPIIEGQRLVLTAFRRIHRHAQWKATLVWRRLRDLCLADLIDLPHSRDPATLRRRSPSCWGSLGRPRSPDVAPPLLDRTVACIGTGRGRSC